jgi:hypothetical protein
MTGGRVAPSGQASKGPGEIAARGASQSGSSGDSKPGMHNAGWEMAIRSGKSSATSRPASRASVTTTKYSRGLMP